MKNKIAFTILLCSLLSYNVFSQKISGKVVDTNDEAVAYANIALYNAKDSSLVKVELSDDNGIFKITEIQTSKYWISVSYVGLSTYDSDIFDLTSDFNLPVIQLSSAGVELNEVTVVAKRPLLEIKPDKMVFNIEGSVNAAGNNALELLKKAPGVVVDNNDKINMLGKSGVMIYIDGKPSPLNGDDLAAFLKTMQASEIDNIEIITNPSAKYDAEGTGGIINIRLKKDQRLGANANISLSYAQGQKKNYNGSINSNYRSKKFNLFGNYSYYNGANINYLNLYREQNGLYFDQTSDMGGGWNGHNFKAGTDYFINKHNTIGVMVNGNINNNDWNSVSRTSIGMLPEQTIDSILIAESHSTRESSNLNFNINYQFDNTKGRTINFDADYGRYRNEGGEYQPNSYKDPTETIVFTERNYRNETPTDIDIYTTKIDVELPAWEGKIGFGAKSSFVQTANTFDFYNVFKEAEVLDPTRSNSFNYTENVNAAYLSYNKQVKKIGIQAGVRAEQTNSEGDLQSMFPTDEDNVKRSYIDFFPSAGLTYQLNPKNSFQLTYSRRINRPSYQDLNPFENKIDELAFESGNPFLNPEYTHSVQLTHSFNYFLNTSIGYSHTTDLITRITDTVGVKGTTITWLNLADQKNYNINVSGAIPITKWWNSYTSVTGFIMDNYAEFEDGKTIDLVVPAFNIYSQHTFTLPKDFSLELSGWYNSASIWEGNFKAEPQYSVDAGIQKKLFEGRGNLKISVSDIFKTSDWAINSQFGPLFIEGSGGWDSRKVRVSFSYLFGNNQVKTRKRKAGLEDESNRIKS
jgi:iron complex outermembrane recepter protein